MSDTFSRRTFASSGLALAASLLPGGPGWTQTITANASLQKPDADQDAASLMARTDGNNHLTIEVMINGKGPFRFVIDTGAERTVIADTVAAALGLPQGDTVTINGISNRITVPTVRVANLSFGLFVRTELFLPILPRTFLFADGYLGLDAINGTRVTFDFQNHALHVEQPRAPLHQATPESETARVRARGADGRLRVTDCLVDSIAATAFIDTGAEVSVGNESLLYNLRRRNKHLTTLGTMTLTGVTGGEVTGDIIPVKRIRLQGLAFTNGSLVIADVPDFSVWKLRLRAALLIGMDYLRQFAAVTIDYRNKEIRFELSLAPPNPRPGVEIEHTV
ncbi:retropepsin-like aspartic protease [Asticcacaulis sp.]|uniref:retropepsin-like aspartic protease n=1 Tax=Asticcacaulis sp. TaxID=1872648 RepID=UPI002BF4FB38|nr:retropepsin-like aspartic protease [Asticcacaulis sp.]HTM80285.1 retropepsin-like aspartic protease [Asticcacaulis sp.]